MTGLTTDVIDLRSRRILDRYLSDLEMEAADFERLLDEQITPAPPAGLSQLRRSLRNRYEEDLAAWDQRCRDDAGRVERRRIAEEHADRIDRADRIAGLLFWAGVFLICVISVVACVALAR
jgi:hypothetical protein